VTGDQVIFELQIICPDDNTFRMEVAQMIADEFASVGIDVSVDFMDLTELVERCFESKGKIHKSGGFDIAIFGWRLELDDDSVYSETLYDTFHSEKSVRKNGGSNIMSWKNANSDDLLEKMTEETDEAKLKEYWLQWQEVFYEEQPLTPIYSFYLDYEGKKHWAFQHVSFNLNHPVLKKKQVRQALSYLIPRQKICNLHNRDGENQMPGTLTDAEPCAVPVNPDSFAFNRNLEPYPYDPETAKELLFKAGYKVKTRKHETAESLLQQAEEAFKNFEFQGAIAYATQAKQLYEELGDEENIVLVNDILLKYKDASNAEDLIEEGTTLRETGEYETAKQKFLEAKQIYQECGLTQKVSETETAISELDELMRKEEILQEADSLFEQGKEAFEEESYESALDYFQQAREKYESVESEKVSECDEWIEKTKIEMEKGFCLGTALVVVLVALGILILKQKD
jgi:tetratricopeptide (TPR) repeat protein